VDADDPRGLMRPRGGVRRPTGPGRSVDGRPAAILAAGVLLGLLLAGPAAAADPVALPSGLRVSAVSPPVAAPTLPARPLPTVKTPSPSIAGPTLRPTPTVPVPTLPLPTLPVPTPPTPSLPTPTLPTPTLPTLPTPTLPTPTLPTPTLPIPTASAIPTASSVVAVGGTAGATPQTVPSPPTSSASSNLGLIGAGLKPAMSEGATGPTDGNASTAGASDRSPLEFIVPGLIAGIPIAVVAFVVFLQVAGGAAWLPVVRRWLDRAPMPGVGQRPR
jgi:hypothetical protein